MSVMLSVFMILTAMIPSQSSTSFGEVEWKTDKATGLVYDAYGKIQQYEGSEVNLVIPSKLGNTAIKKIGSSVFYNNTTLKSVTLPNGLTEIGDNAFGSCPELTTVKFPSTLKLIDDFAFTQCPKLTKVTFPEGLKTINQGAFLFCKSITELKIPSSVTTLGVGAFQGVSIKSITIPSGITKISGALFGETLLESVVIPKNIQTIEDEAFAKCPNLKSVTIPKTVTKIGHNAFNESPQVTVYGTNGSVAQVYSANYNIKFVDSGAAATPTVPVVKTDSIVIPTDAAGPKVTAKASKAQFSVKGNLKRLEGYTINGQAYYKMADLGAMMAGTEVAFNPGYSKGYHIMQLKSDVEQDLGSLSVTGDGKDKQAARVYPTIYFGEIDASNAISVYSINGNDYYKFADVMNIINCGVINNTKTGIMTINPDLNYEPLNSPVFSPVPSGSATYMKVQKALYDAYYKGLKEISASDVIVPDNTTLYVPRGVVYGEGDNRTITLGTNSSFIVKGKWNTEYPTRNIKAKSASTKNAVYTYHFNPIEAVGTDGANNNVIYVSSKNNFQWGNMPLTSAKIAYGAVSEGVQQIALDVTRDKRDPETCVYVYFHVNGGESYGYLYKNVNESINLMPQLATVIAKNVGKKATIDRINVQNANGVSLSTGIVLPVNWTITTSGTAPTEVSTIDYYEPFSGNCLVFKGLAQKSYIAKVKFQLGTGYSVISPKNEYMVTPVQAQMGGDLDIVGNASNVALFTGKKVSTGKDAYAFTVSPFSSNISYNAKGF